MPPGGSSLTSALIDDVIPVAREVSCERSQFMEELGGDEMIFDYLNC
jgi:hypothetical protein